MKLHSINPANNELVGEVEVSTEVEIKAAVDRANKAKKLWKETPLKERIELLRKTEKLFKAKAVEIAELITKEVGTPIEDCKSEVEWNWSYWDWFLEHAAEALNPETTFEDGGQIHQVFYEPTGTAAVITPWNLPFDLFVWGVVPNLLAGNTVVYKASGECILTGQLLAEIMAESPLPKGVFNAVYGDGRHGEILINQDIDLIWFTGSSTVGKKLYELAGKKFIKAILEMGGSNPAIVFADADLDKAATSIISKRFMFCGQTCDADKRLIVEESIAEKLIEKLKQQIATLTEMGPLAAERQRKLLETQVRDAMEKGAIILAQAKVKGNEGAYYPPTLLGKVQAGMRVWNEEVFGPVLPIMTFKDEAEAIKLANDTVYGLGSQVFSKDVEKALRVAGKLDAGNVDINGVGHFRPMNPFGGYKLSGMGREHGIHGFRELCQIKVITRNK